MPHFFISYAKKDTKALAIDLMNALQQLEGVTAWTDASLNYGEDWELQIQAEIDRCDFMIVLYSPDINRHKLGDEKSYVLNEIAYAKRVAKKSIVPVMAQETDPPLSLVNDHYIDNFADVSQLVEKICLTTKIPLPSERGHHNTQFDLTELSRLTEGILASPFEWIHIPAGDFLYGKDNQKLYLPDYAIAKYPITFAQFQKFIDAPNGMQNDRWLEGLHNDALKYRIMGKQYNPIADHPREFVSWYHSIAFCRWLSFRLWAIDIHNYTSIQLPLIENYTPHNSGTWLVRLPIQEEWEKAARGVDGLQYPWDGDFDPQKSNSKVSKIGKTTPVTTYSEGVSPFGVWDMVGNVWEWCLNSDIETYKVFFANQIDVSSKNNRIARGGCWDNIPILLKTYMSGQDAPYGTNFCQGFRIAMSITSE